MEDKITSLIGLKVNLPNHFPKPVFVEMAKSLGHAVIIQVRTADGKPDETVLTYEEIEELLPQISAVEAENKLVSGDDLRLLIESLRIRLAYCYDPHFAVSLSGIQSLPHQIEAVYGKMLPQAMLRFLLADDPGAGKTIMTGLLIKELKLRRALERVIIIVPAALTIQWQDELLRFFDEFFIIINADNDRQQLGNLWQRESQVITSLDYAKQTEVRERVWAASWDLVVLDEAHKCSAYTKRSSRRSPEAEKTKRYQLIEHFSSRSTLSLLFLTATPHQGDEDRFSHFLHLLDPDLFPEPHRLMDKAGELLRGVLSLGKDCPWMLRRLKEDLRDFDGKRLFPDRHSQTVTFTLGVDEYSLYHSVSEYLNRFLAGGTGRAKQSIALTRTVLQRRLASSTFAIYESLKRRLKRQEELLDELRSLPPEKQRQRLAELMGKDVDDERDEDDLDETERDTMVDEVTAAHQLDQLAEEVVALRDLVVFAESVYGNATDSKLNTLKKVLAESEFSELRDGRGKLLIFTEHRDTMTYLSGHLQRWGYIICNLHGGMNPRERKQAQDDFRAKAQICVATEAAGEGINLQFCHLMINYDLPWNPTRLEQRMGRIHRIGQEREVYVFNFVAESSVDGRPVIEGRILKILLDKLEQIRQTLGSDRVYDVIGQILALNDVNLADMLREAALFPGRLSDYEDQIMQLTPEKLHEYEEQTGIALAQAFVDVPAIREQAFLAEEKRLMPEYIARQFIAASERIGLRVESRADGLWRVPYIPQDLRSDSLEAVRRFGKPEDHYNKITFHKSHLSEDRHLDAVLISPGHPLYAVVDEKLNQKLGDMVGRWALFVDINAEKPYVLHFFDIQLMGDYPKPNVIVYSEMVAVRQDGVEQASSLLLVPPDIIHDIAPLENPNASAPSGTGKMPVLPVEQASSPSLVPPDIIHDIAPLENPNASVPSGTGKMPVLPVEQASSLLKNAESFVRCTYQLDERKRRVDERARQAKIISEYLEKSFEERLWAAQRRRMELKARYEGGEREVELALGEAEREIENIKRLREERLGELKYLGIVRAGPVRYISSFFVLPSAEFVDTQIFVEDMEAKKKSEEAAMRIAREYEIRNGREPEDVSQQKIGFDIRSLSPPDPSTGVRNVRRIEVKGRLRGQPIRLTENEWLKAMQLRDTYWLYVVWNPTMPDHELITIPSPAERLSAWAKEVKTISHYEISAEYILRIAMEGQNE